MEEKKEKYYFNYPKAIIFLLIILIGLFIYDKHDEWKQEKEIRDAKKEIFDYIEKLK